MNSLLIYDSEDLELENDREIENLSESNIGIKIIKHPFSFSLYRKDSGEPLFDNTYSNESKISSTIFSR